MSSAQEQPAQLEDMDASHRIGVGPGGACPECSHPLDIGQEFCLDCGTNVTRPPQKKQPAQTGQGQVVMHPAMLQQLQQQKGFPWISLVIFILLAIAGLTFVLLNADSGPSDSDSSTENEAAALIEQLGSSSSADEDASGSDDDTASASGADDPLNDTTSTTDDDALASDETDSATSEDPGAGDTDWPADQSGHTIIIASYNKGVYLRAKAQEQADEVAAQGFETGVLDSDQLSSLAPGYWVVFSGVYDTEEGAQADLDRVVDAGNIGAFVKFI